jgi:CheY-like chemotaxis protein
MPGVARALWLLYGDEIKMAGPILVVEDDAAVREVLIAALVEEMGLEVASAASGGEALSMLRSLRPSMVLLDLTMPEVSGLDVLEHMRGDAATSTIPVVSMTALSASSAERQAALEAGSIAILDKPFDLQELMDTIEGVLSGALRRER